ncbi:related to Vacuolar integral membrane protein YDR352W [Hanseniaspora guilliermondii]|uniref:Related to Vacuolar integral membrane protein YDR352W n=1 Tax=Hanseniaspora guilliermondii TaxID=56406 RepID=A0A1L0AYX3_9ASCO|nr:related to Vacuolar integral membrane protein YDR352W [Hanseniaspora guilliermondii]
MNSTTRHMIEHSVPISYCANNPSLSHISSTSGGIAFLLSLISQFPQLVETYNDKSVEGISPLLIGAWLLGDITSVLGAIYTEQLPFQILLAIYFLSNDLIICGQYYYYGILYKNKLATAGHQHLNHQPSHASNNNKFGKIGVLILGLFTRSSNAMSIMNIETSVTSIEQNDRIFQIGLILSWFSGMFYFTSRIPQLYKFYKRKSTDGVSPYMFYCTIFHNILYAVSIFSSCEFIDNKNKYLFFKKELPFLLGSIGTLLWDFIYLYQHFVLYADDKRIRDELKKLNIVDEDVDIENEPLLATSNEIVYTSV